jgi:VanZ family protein
MQPTHLAGLLLRFHDTTLDDVAVNVLAYAVLAAALFYFSRRKRAAEAIGIIALCSALSLIVEMLQALVPQRVSSATDVLLNGIGAALGVAACAVLLSSRHRIVHAVARELRERPLGLCAVAISSALLAYNLIPFDFITNTGQLHASFRRIQLLGFPSGLAAITNELSGAAWFAVLGFLVTRNGLGQGCSHVHALRAGLQHGLVLACLIECLQLFTNSHVPELTTAIIRVLGAFFGAWTAAFLAPHPRIRINAARRRPCSPGKS